MGLKISFEGKKRHFVSIKDSFMCLTLHFCRCKDLVMDLKASRFAGVRK